MRLCQWHHVFGRERQGVHAYRVLDVAVVDVLLTAVVALFVSRRRFMQVFLGLVLLSVPVHWLFCVDTTLTRLFVSIAQPQKAFTQ